MKNLILIVASLVLLTGCGDKQLEEYLKRAAATAYENECPGNLTPQQIQMYSAVTGIDCLQSEPKPNKKAPLIFIEPADPVKPSPDDTYEVCKYWGRYNGDRATWYCSRNLDEYPLPFTVSVPGCGSFKVTKVTDSRFESDAGNIVKQSDVQNRGAALVMRSECKATEATFSW